jgi:hypothetical protein
MVRKMGCVKLAEDGWRVNGLCDRHAKLTVAGHGLRRSVMFVSGRRQVAQPRRRLNGDARDSRRAPIVWQATCWPLWLLTKRFWPMGEHAGSRLSQFLVLSQPRRAICITPAIGCSSAGACYPLLLRSLPKPLRRQVIWPPQRLISLHGLSLGGF